LLALSGANALPAYAGGDSSSPGSPPATVSPVFGGGAGGHLAQIASEVPPAEAELINLLDTSYNRLTAIAAQIAAIDRQVDANQAVLDAANAELAARRHDEHLAYVDLDRIAVELAAARLELRDRAVFAYVHPYTGELTNLFLHARDPGELDLARGFYHALLGAQLRTILRYEALRRRDEVARERAAHAAARADAQRQTVQAQQAKLVPLRRALEDAQHRSQEQADEQARLLAVVAADKGQFTQDVGALAAKSNEIGQFLRGLATDASNGPPGSSPGSSSPGGSPSTPSSVLSFPIPGAPVTSGFGPRLDPLTGVLGLHPGVDFAANEGTPIRAAGPGHVAWAGDGGGYGNFTCVANGALATCYAHQLQVLVRVGQVVKRGQIIGLVGSTGYSSGPHLHFEVRVDGNPVDPMPWLR